MLNGMLFIYTMCQFFGQALINHMLEVFITRIDGIKQDLRLYKATADFKHIKLSCSVQLWVWKSFWGSPLLWFEEPVMARQNRNTDPVKPHMGRNTSNHHLTLSTLFPFLTLSASMVSCSNIFEWMIVMRLLCFTVFPGNTHFLWPQEALAPGTEP